MQRARLCERSSLRQCQCRCCSTPKASTDVRIPTAAALSLASASAVAKGHAGTHCSVNGNADAKRTTLIVLRAHPPYVRGVHPRT
eukprot:6180712-Pleurochrysis_carterae.AAC.1